MTSHRAVGAPADDPLWYKDAIIYELHVRSFCDSDADGIGDFDGLIGKLDYLESLGVTAIWLLPFYPSPLKDDGYDIADYTSVNPSYGTLADFRRFLREAHRRGLRVITELVINHTSSQHPWFQRARRSPPGSRYRNFYVWSDTPERYRDTRIIFQDFETSNWSWDPVAKAYYWHRFYSHQPDLNFENPEVQEALFRVLDFWMDVGVDGMRLDAVPYLFEREGTNCENLPETHAFLKRLRGYIEGRYRNRMLLAEANQWPEDAASYFGDGDECHMNFHFPLMPRMFMALNLEDRLPILDILDQTPTIPPTCQWATFLRNHDELTLEMVTDEDRDYMWRVYAEDKHARINLGIRRRLAPLLRARAKIELLNGLLLSLPGTPVLYYGDEIGMGDNIYVGDRDGVRTPMQWSPDRNAGFSRANPQRLFLPVIVDPEFHYEAVNVETELANPSSLLWWMRRLIGMRRRYPAFSRGDMRILHPRNKKVLAFLRCHEGEHVLIVANLSRYSQHVELDLDDYAGRVPEELFGRVTFPPIEKRPYFVSLGPHGFFWFVLTQPAVESRPELGIPSLGTIDRLSDVLRGSVRRRLEDLLPAYLVRQRWFRSKTRRVRAVHIIDELAPDEEWSLLLIRVDFYEGLEEIYLVPLALCEGEDATAILEGRGGCVVARVALRSGADAAETQAIVYDGSLSEGFAREVLEMLTARKGLRGKAGRLVPRARSRWEGKGGEDQLPARVGTAEQTNTSILYGDRYILKLQRQVEAGINADVEIVRFLNEQTPFRQCPELLGTLEYHSPGREPATVAALQRFIPNRGDAWKFTLESLDRYYEDVLTRAARDELDVAAGGMLGRVGQELPGIAEEALGPYLPMVRLLARRTAELHSALASKPLDASFAYQAFTELHQRSLYQSARSMLIKTMDALSASVAQLDEDNRAKARTLIERRGDLEARLRRIMARKIEAVRIRCHGDFHLGQVLYTGKDFVIIDFEGEPARTINERRFKRCPLRDVAGMLRSFHYAAEFALQSRQGDRATLEHLHPWAQAWPRWVGATYLDAYLEASRSDFVIPTHARDVEDLLQFYLLEKCIYELRYELDHRPGWVGLPLTGLEELVRQPVAGG